MFSPRISILLWIFHSLFHKLLKTVWKRQSFTQVFPKFFVDFSKTLSGQDKIPSASSFLQMWRCGKSHEKPVYKNYFQPFFHILLWTSKAGFSTKIVRIFSTTTGIAARKAPKKPISPFFVKQMPVFPYVSTRYPNLYHMSVECRRKNFLYLTREISISTVSTSPTNTTSGILSYSYVMYLFDKRACARLRRIKRRHRT